MERGGSASLLVCIFLGLISVEAFLNRLLHLLHECRVLHLVWLSDVLLESDLTCLGQSVQGVHGLFNLPCVTIVRGLLNRIVDLLGVLIDKDGENLLRVGLLSIFSLGLSVYHNLLSSHGLWSLHHLCLHLAHWVVKLLHVAVASDQHLWCDDLLLLSLIGEALCIEELILDSRLTCILTHEAWVDKDRSCIHQHCLLAILSWCTELRLSRILIESLSRHDVLLHLTSIHHSRCHHGLLHADWHLLLATFIVKLVRASHLQFLLAMSE